ncbi:hypothetical protein CkaCkLH20_07888 [Colletotrichum karsti]|uniref:Uncharacterized protein n=1 Tax=Colletotrichum karsti TaxID=1095194 RepID=A0A9P6I4B0_9PEZI|nr:uncharacterized protein CkaCkLH20_07888 [Colletotrichum karsti]KAF9874751.1 hypothetical protein CkaCkLH20_07888 [Colletotrichum karsti]
MLRAALITNVLSAVSLLWGPAAAMPAGGSAVSNPLDKRAIPLPNFDMNLENAEEQSKTLQFEAWPQLILMAKMVHQKVDPERWNRVFAHYFDTKDRDSVERVFALIMGASGLDDPGEPLGSAVFEKVAFVNQDTIPGVGCSNSTAQANAWTDLRDNRYRLKICERGWRFPLLGKTTCEELGNNVSGLMSSLPGLILHELLLIDWIGKEATGTHVRDFLEGTDDIEFDGTGPLNVRKFKDDKKFDTRFNADQYRWFAQEYYWSVICSKDFEAPSSNSDYI